MAETGDLLDKVLDAAIGLDVLDDSLVAPDQEKSPDELFWLDPIDERGVTQPWAQYEDEPTKAYALFQFYLSLPRAKRSFKAVDQHYDLDNTANRQAAKYEWPERTLAWDLERDRLYQIEVIEEMQEMGRRHGRKLDQAIEAITLPLVVLAEEIERNPEGVKDELRDKTLTQQLSMAVKSARGLPNLMAAERLARGLPTEITANIHSGKIEHVHTPNLSEVTDILQGLHDAGAIALVGGPTIDVGEEAATEIEHVSQDDADDETDGLSSSR